MKEIQTDAQTEARIGQVNALSPILEQAMEYRRKSDEALLSDDPQENKKALEYLKESVRLYEEYAKLRQKITDSAED